MAISPRLSGRSVLYISRRAKLQEPLARQLLRILWLLVCACATAYLVFLSFPSASRSVLAWLAWAPFIWGVLKIRRAWSAFFYGGLTAFLFQAGLLYWVYYTCLHGGGLSVWLSGAAWLGLSALLALQFAFFGVSCYFLKKTGGLFPLLAACGFVTLEWLHQTLAFYGLGFPWLMWGYTQWNAPEVLQLAAYGGVYGVSFVLIWVSALVGWALASGQMKRVLWSGLLAGASCLGLFWWGSSLLPADARTGLDARPALQVDAALIQPNIDQYKKWDPEFEQEIVDTLTRFGDELANQGLLLTVWPESAMPGDLLEEKYFNLMEDITVRSASYQVIGSTVQQDGRQYVGAYLMAPFTDQLQVYKKVKLVPFGEYVPLEKLLRRLFPHVDILGALGVFSAGHIHQPLLQLGGIQLGSTICYEAIFPQLWREQARQGAQLFVNLTNDAWFFDTAAPHQHLAANVLRAAETRRPVLRAANTGISAVIDPFGRIMQQSALFTPDLLRAQVPLAAQDAASFYTAYGNCWIWLCAALFFTCLIFTMVFMYE